MTTAAFLHIGQYAALPLGRNLVRLLDASGLTKQDLADLIGVQPQAIQHWITGASFPLGMNILRMAQALQVNPDEFFRVELEPLQAPEPEPEGYVLKPDDMELLVVTLGPLVGELGRALERMKEPA